MLNSFRLWVKALRPSVKEAGKNRIDLVRCDPTGEFAHAFEEDVRPRCRIAIQKRYDARVSIFNNWAKAICIADEWPNSIRVPVEFIIEAFAIFL